MLPTWDGEGGGWSEKVCVCVCWREFWCVSRSVGGQVGDGTGRVMDVWARVCGQVGRCVGRCMCA